MFNPQMFTAFHPVCYYRKANEFWLAACCLEEESDEAEKCWLELSQMLNPTPGSKRIEIDSDIGREWEFCMQIMGAGFNVALYLRAVSIELLLKGLYWEHLKKSPPLTHHVSKLYENLENVINETELKVDDVKILLNKLDEILIWAGRYPEPINDKRAEEVKRKLSRTTEGYHSDSLRSVVDIKLLKELYISLIKHASLWKPRLNTVAESEQ